MVNHLARAVAPRCPLIREDHKRESQAERLLTQGLRAAGPGRESGHDVYGGVGGPQHCARGGGGGSSGQQAAPRRHSPLCACCSSKTPVHNNNRGGHFPLSVFPARYFHHSTASLAGDRLLGSSLAAPKQSPDIKVAGVPRAAPCRATYLTCS